MTKLIAVAGDLAWIDLPDRIIKQLPTKLLAKHTQWRDLHRLQSQQLQQIIALQQQLTGQHPLHEEIPSQKADVQTAEPKSEPGEGLFEGNVTIDAVANDVLPGKSCSSTDAEKQLLAYFSLQDTLSKEALSFLANKTGRNESQIRQLFTRWRCNIRDLIQKLQRNSSGFPVGSHAAPAGPGIPSSTLSGNSLGAQLNTSSVQMGVYMGVEDPSGHSCGSDAHIKSDNARQEGLQRLQACVDSSGGIGSGAAADNLALLMKTSRNWSVREECARAIVKTKAIPVLQRIASAQNLLAMIASWIREGAKEGQTGFLSYLLQAIGRFSLTAAQLRFNGLHEAVVLAKLYKRGQISQLAQWVLQQWGLIDQQKTISKSQTPNTVNPSKMAVPLTKAAPPNKPLPVGRKATSSSDTAHRKRASDTNLSSKKSVKARRLGLEKKVSTLGGSGSGRLDLNSLASIRGPNRGPLAKPKVETEEQAVVSKYEELYARMQHAHDLQQAREARQFEKVRQDLRMRQTVLQDPAGFPPFFIQIKGLGPSPAAGEESKEKHVQAERIRLKPIPIKYSSTSQIPDSPGEPSGGDEPLQIPPRIPFHPPDPREAAEQLKTAYQAGLRLPHLLIIPTNLIAPRQGQHPAPLPYSSQQPSMWPQPSV